MMDEQMTPATTVVIGVLEESKPIKQWKDLVKEAKWGCISHVGCSNPCLVYQ